MLKDKTSSPRSDLPGSSQIVRNNFVVGELLGSGSFGNVYAVELKSNRSKRFAMKELTRNSLPKFIATELRVLRNFGGVFNIMQMYAAFRDHERVFIVMDYFPHDQISDLLPTITNVEILAYMRNLLIALNYLHSKGIIHRDIKPSNFLYNRKEGRYSLIDFGLAQTYDPKNRSFLKASHRSTFGTSNGNFSNTVRGSTMFMDDSLCIFGDENARGMKRKSDGLNSSYDMNRSAELRCPCLFEPTICSKCTKLPQNNANKAGTPGFRAPEVLLRSMNQTCAIDIWSAGITFLSICARKHPIMRVDDDCEALGQMATIFGEQELKALGKECNQELMIEPPCTRDGVDLVMFAKFVHKGFEAQPPPVRPCLSCRELIHENCKGYCMCISGYANSLRELPPDERTIFEVVRSALFVSPEKRYSAQMLLSLLQ
ncbi:hypothetical protein QR680_017281 [Steinernema hermaphroditum]|uniref:non-specific serine/threonine protein kinase n=1 Tax=Steinernema hermaphroditum TaxID=289476 RepID=A0AA39HEI6_9BILA|nr:hypothetical protein QR680_017281 [Steinernema hermaphroditum]